MTVYFLDASALAKPYLRERGSSRVEALTASQTIIISMLSVAEVASALGRRAREGHLTLDQREGAFQTFMRHILRYQVVAISQAVIEEAARTLLDGLDGAWVRTGDAIQLATARRSFILSQASGHEGIFVTADERLLGGAAAAGFVTENPQEDA